MLIEYVLCVDPLHDCARSQVGFEAAANGPTSVHAARDERSCKVTAGPCSARATGNRVGAR
jgi:hypothetical protein